VRLHHFRRDARAGGHHADERKRHAQADGQQAFEPRVEMQGRHADEMDEESYPS
jgi:hypothetical protein